MCLVLQPTAVGVVCHATAVAGPAALVTSQETHMYDEFVGARSEATPNWVERGAVRRFAEAIGDANPLYTDEDAAKRGRYGRMIAPLTFPITFDHGEIPGLALPPAGLIHGQQSFDYTRPLYVGEAVSCYQQLESSYDRRGGQGLMTFLVFKSVGMDEAGATIYTMSATLIVTEAVRGKVPA